jgi:hypothetical protein
MPWQLFPQGKSLWYPLGRMLGGPQSQSGCGGEVKNSQPLLGLKHLIIQPIAQCYTTELFQFHWDIFFKVFMYIIGIELITCAKLGIAQGIGTKYMQMKVKLFF